MTKIKTGREVRGAVLVSVGLFVGLLTPGRLHAQQFQVPDARPATSSVPAPKSAAGYSPWLAAQQSKVHDARPATSSKPAPSVPATQTSDSYISDLTARANAGDAKAQDDLGSTYYYGLGVPQDYKEAVNWYRKAAEQGLAAAQSNLGGMYFNGDGVPQDYKEAMKWFRKAAEQGDRVEQNSLGIIYKYGIGVPQDYKEAVKWFRKAAEQGYALAQISLGLAYDLGRGVPQDYKEAVNWYRKGADQGDDLAQFSLGSMYFNGRGVPQDYVLAYAWCCLAAAQGDSDAATLRDGLQKQMTRDQVAEGQRQAAAFDEAIKSPKSPRTDDTAGPSARPEPPGELTGTGTGFFVTEDGWFVTCAHVVTEGKRILVKKGDKVFSATLKKIDTQNDLALLKVEGAFSALPIQSSGPAKLGDSVISVGFPNPDLQGIEPKFTKGEICGLSGIQDDPRFFQISTPVQPGNSGGALVNAAGNVVGVVSGKLSDVVGIKESGAIPQNVNYATKSSYLLVLIESVPELNGKLKKPLEKNVEQSEVVKAVEAATAMVAVMK